MADLASPRITSQRERGGAEEGGMDRQIEKGDIGRTGPLTQNPCSRVLCGSEIHADKQNRSIRCCALERGLGIRLQVHALRTLKGPVSFLRKKATAPPVASSPKPARPTPKFVTGILINTRYCLRDVCNMCVDNELEQIGGASIKGTLLGTFRKLACFPAVKSTCHCPQTRSR